MHSELDDVDIIVVIVVFQVLKLFYRYIIIF